jgi:hypothetical protein
LFTPLRGHRLHLPDDEVLVTVPLSLVDMTIAHRQRSRVADTSGTVVTGPTVRPPSIPLSR